MQKMNTKMAMSLVIASSLCFGAWAQQINVQVPANQQTAITVEQTGVSKAAGIKQVNESNDSETFFPALKDDLVNADSPSLASVKHDGYTNFQACRIEAINDGEVGNASSQASIAFDLHGTWTSTFILKTEKAPKGYDIKEIRTIAGWPASRANQKYELLISKVGSPDTFVSLGTFENVIDKNGSTKITLTGEKGTLASGVAAIRFMIMVAGQPGNTETAYREIDVIGEPSKN